VGELFAAIGAMCWLGALLAGSVIGAVLLLHSWRCVFDSAYRRQQGDVSLEFLLVWASVAVLAFAVIVGV
jgi:hypothetical protein